MKLVVLGAAGQLGQVMTAQARRQHTVVAWTRAEADITKPEVLAAALAAESPDAVINCAAYARVDEAEDEPENVFAINAWAIRDLARLATAQGFALVHYSTDFVFDGLDASPRHETDPVNPRGVYATSKLTGEWFAAETPAHYILRVESLFGGPAAKSSVDVLLNGLRAGREVRAFADRTVTPSFVTDVADATLSLLERRAAHGLYHCVNSGHTTWVDLTHELARLVGRPSSLVTPVNMAGLSMRVPRPLHAALANDKLRAAGIEMPGWQDALARYVTNTQSAVPRA